MAPKVLLLLVSFVVSVGSALGAVVWSATGARHQREIVRAERPRHAAPVDHAAFFAEPFADGPAVTRRCLECHPGAALEVMGTAHWTWTEKRHGINNFCIGVSSNWARCTSCHAGYGWEDDRFLETATPDRVDCLVCHDGSGLYQKDAAGAGRPAPGVDLLAAAKSVGRTSRATCGSCHFKGGGGDAVKHGDLDGTLSQPADRLDVHMGRLDMRCADCHRTSAHRVRGRLMPPEADPETRAACTDCHDAAPHGDERLDRHTSALACQTCHVPRFAPEAATKLWWDWSLAGRDGDPERVAAALAREVASGGQAALHTPLAIRALFASSVADPGGDLEAHYDRKKGLFLLGRRQTPEYRWYDGTARRHLPGQRYDGTEPLVMNAPGGSVRDARARIWPFKVHRGVQPFDLEARHLLVPHTFGPGGYWSAFDWDRALRDGAAASGVSYSGNAGWVSTEMYWPQNHNVTPKEEALRCADCHGAGGRMDWKALGYPGDPSRVGGRRPAAPVGEEAR